MALHPAQVVVNGVMTLEDREELQCIAGSAVKNRSVTPCLHSKNA